MNDIFKLISNQLENKLLNELSKDFPELSEEDLKNFIYKKTRGDINKPNINHKNRFKSENELVLDNIFTNDNKTINQWKRQLLNRYGKDKECNYYIMIESFKVFKNKTIYNNVNMNKLELFKETYKQVFQPYHNKENASVWKQKKFRLKKKMLADNPDILDYEYIMFDKLQQFISI
tara:strand:+ start:185 stop:712 length:528 start_codon:yes stop_codon:yes gene_type:complete